MVPGFTRAILLLALLPASCSPAPTRITESRSAYEADIAPLGEALAVVWHESADGGSRIALRMVGPEGEPIGPVLALTDASDPAYEPSVTAIGGDAVAIAWYTKAADGATAAYIGAWRTDGTRRWIQPLSPSPARNPVVFASRLAIFAAWIQREPDGSEGIWRQWWTRDGEPIGPPTFLAPASATTWSLNAVADDAGAAWVVFDADTSTRASEVYLARDDASGEPLQRLTRDDGIPSKFPDIAVRAGTAAVAWHDERDGNSEIYLVIEGLDGIGNDGDARAMRVTTSDGESIGAYVAWNEERVGLAWSDATGGEADRHEIYFQEFDAGRARSEPLRVTETETASMIPAIGPWGDGFVLAWNEYEPAGGDTPAFSDVAIYFAGGQ